jgi:hypothetical protein
MTYRSVAARPKEKISCAALELPETFLACYEIVNKDELRWNVRSYTVRSVNGDAKSHEDRGGAKQVIWDLRKKH